MMNDLYQYDPKYLTPHFTCVKKTEYNVSNRYRGVIKFKGKKVWACDCESPHMAAELNGSCRFDPGGAGCALNKIEFLRNVWNKNHGK